jgi:hypothetical protein
MKCVYNIGGRSIYHTIEANSFSSREKKNSPQRAQRYAEKGLIILK